MSKLITEFPKNSLETVRISITEYRGKTYGDIRVYYRADDGEWRPTKKGLTLAPELIPELKNAIKALEQELTVAGLIEQEQ